MPIPIRSRSPIKANSSVGDGSSTTGAAAPKKLPPAKEPARLTREHTANPASLRATNITSRPQPITSTGNARPKVSISTTSTSSRGVDHSLSVSGHVRSQSAISAATIGASRNNTAPPSTSASHSHAPPASSSRNPDGVRIPTSKSHARTLSAATKPTTERRTAAAAANDSLPKPKPKTTTTRPTSSRLPGPTAPDAGTRSASSRKPVFDTFKQHYSPKKAPAPAPPPSTTLPQDPASTLPAAGAGVGGLSADVASLQGDLLQLSLVHEGAAARLQAYEDSAKLSLRGEVENVKSALIELRSLQSDRQARVNAAAVKAFFDEHQQDRAVAGTGADALLVLGHCVKELDELGRENGPLESAMRTFEGWLVFASSRSASRTTSTSTCIMDDDENAGRDRLPARFLVPMMDPQWSALLSSVQDRAKACSASLANLPRLLPQSSSIGTLIKLHSMLAEHILQEIEICRDVERLILQQEESRMETSVRQALAQVDAQRGAETNHAVDRKGIWQNLLSLPGGAG